MSAKQASFALIVVSLIAAAVMLFSSYFLDGSNTVMFLIIAVWFVPFSLLSARAVRKTD